MDILDQLKYNSDGLIPAIIQDEQNGQVLMMGFMNREAVKHTLESGRVCFWSRSRAKLWVKGETSGHFQFVKGVYVDCDMDCLLIKVEQIGATCHEGYRSCFYRQITQDGTMVTVAERVFDPKEVYQK